MTGPKPCNYTGLVSAGPQGLTASQHVQRAFGLEAERVRIVVAIAAAIDTIHDGVFVAVSVVGLQDDVAGHQRRARRVRGVWHGLVMTDGQLQSLMLIPMELLMKTMMTSHLVGWGRGQVGVAAIMQVRLRTPTNLRKLMINQRLQESWKLSSWAKEAISWRLITQKDPPAGY